MVIVNITIAVFGDRPCLTMYRGLDAETFWSRYREPSSRRVTCWLEFLPRAGSKASGYIRMLFVGALACSRIQEGVWDELEGS